MTNFARMNLISSRIFHGQDILPCEQEYVRLVERERITRSNNRFLHARVETWVENVREKENEILQAAEKLRGKVLTPYAESLLSSHSNGVKTGTSFQE
mmetsp:Transcript_6953/g.20856  ORF Transcript_6953/g.20856 Transcript_6953/m.20856 type:complete len:98 (-) Transcript_6953:614-907(-)